jgi:hypothetical protein
MAANEDEAKCGAVVGDHILFFESDNKIHLKIKSN